MYQVYLNGVYLGNVQEGCTYCQHQFMGHVNRHKSECQDCRHNKDDDSLPSRFELTEGLYKEED